ncbi:MAG: fructose-6-phosphate aldolase [Bdellovibrionaceae bacterium]|nr:fructose-6-phosphate aldolase [Pseudobdellovibrionaceae bacterium]
MKFFIDTADISEIKDAHNKGWMDGVTTNPSLVAKTGKPHKEVIASICEIVKGPVSAEVLALDSQGMIKEGKELAKIADNVVVKIPMTEEGMIAVKTFAAEGIQTNVTLVFSPMQALLAAKAGATMVSPFVGRLDDISHIGMDIISQIQSIYRNYDFQTEVLVASIRHPIHLLEAAMIGADIATIPYKVFPQLTRHPLTDKGLEQFLADAQKVPNA